MPLLRLVLDVGGRDRDAARLLLGGVVDRVEGAELREPLLRQDLGDRRGERGLAMVDVTDGPDVHVRLGALVLLLRHCYSFLRNLLRLSTWQQFLRQSISALPGSDGIPCCRRRGLASSSAGRSRSQTCSPAGRRRAPPASWPGLPCPGSGRGATTG